MSIFTISDLHLSLGSDKPMDIFHGWNDYIPRLEKNWKNLIKDSDTVVIPGDISWAMKLDQTRKDFAFINSLPGKKLFIKGNHDYWWSTKGKMEKYLDQNGFDSISIIFNSAFEVENVCICGTRGWMYDCDSDEDIKILSREVGRLEKSISIAKKTKSEPIVFIHYPPVYGDHECEEILNVLLKNEIKKCYYGHIHGGNAVKKAIIGQYKGIEFNLVSCDYINFTPLLVKN